MSVQSLQGLLGRQSLASTSSSCPFLFYILLISLHCISLSLCKLKEPNTKETLGLDERERKLNKLYKTLSIYISSPTATYQPSPNANLLAGVLTQPQAALGGWLPAPARFSVSLGVQGGFWVSAGFFTFHSLSLSW